MDIVRLHHLAEQRCKPLGCRMKSCQESAQDPNLCQQYHRELLECISKEKARLIDNWNRTGKFSS
ncbi:unnamed protein product (macronuclear) [Paramecium tetraurelia]|uniref:CHCH domain-containing protein n=2 Tax=Paramecium TaxID=5884 RepID=A0DK39_PARTE|nr:uncharacterized protein GSPATT00017735001 [Paramecium tetraurelia]CAD8171225.1 unnamed protein product [Paramecium octaurelia]CAK83406.1 unnamed protein product [Paramecium tetraurelia]|eukprot:XP_001450803.1 hypothetical protein (macronuclear) [Paramecium tetraurelia strain d4-2]